MTMLPSDRYLCSLLGLTEEEFQIFQAEARQYLKEHPIEGPIAGSTAVTLAIISLVLSVGATALSLLLRPSIPETKAPGQIKRGESIDDPIITNQSFAPRYGFDSVQNVVKIGSTIPLVYGKKFEVGGANVGGVRLNMPLVWSQMLSFGTSQMLRGVFLASESEIENFDADLWAIGSNLLKGYKFSNDVQTEAAARVCVYVSKDGGAIIESDRVFGRSGLNDRRSNGGGSSSSSSTGEVFQVQLGASQTETSAFSAVHTPSSSTIFGVYGFIGNDLAYKVNPIIQAGCKLQTKPLSSGEVRPKCPYDEGRISRRLKDINHFASFSGIFKKNNTALTTNGNLTLAKGDTVTYKLFHESEKLLKFRKGDSDTDELSQDVASSVASRQTQYDQNLVIGEVYKIGSALGVLTSRTDDVFRSEAENITGVEQSIEAVFTIVEDGECFGYTATHLKGRHTGSDVILTNSTISTGNTQRAVATNKGHILRYAQAIVTNTRPCHVTEIGIDSKVGGRIGGLCNFVDAKTFQEADDLMCEAKEEQDTEDVESTTYQSSTITVSFTRFSCFTVQYKEIGPDATTTWNDSGEVLAISSETQQSVFNFIRFEFQDQKTRIFRLSPLSGFEVRSKTSGRILMLNANGDYNHLALPSGTWGSNTFLAFKGTIVTAPFHNSFRSQFNEGDSALQTDYTKVRKKTGDADGEIKDLEPIFSPGSGYGISGSFTNVATIVNTGSGSGATLNITTNASGEVSTVTLNNTGSGYSDNQTLTVNEADIGGTGSGAGFSCTISDTAEWDTLSFKGLPTVDTNAGSGYGSYVDDFLKLAEDFIYEEANTSADAGPEHRVSYVNEIVKNQTGTYADMGLVGVNIRSSNEWTQFTQFSGYINGGIKTRSLADYTSGSTFSPTDTTIFHFPDVLLDLMTNARYGMGDFVKDQMIDLAGFKQANDWCTSRSYHFDGVVADLVNVRQYAADLAATHLLFFAEINGQFTLKPALPVSGATFVAADIKGLFTVGNIIEDSYEVEYLNPEDREPIEVSVTYREERASVDTNSEGSFALVREVLVKEVGYTPLETVSLDMTDYCTQRNHAIDAAKFIIRMRRITDHLVKFKITHESIYNNIAPGDYINVAMDATEYDDFSNGVVTGAGALVSTETFADGSYQVFAWDPNSGNDPAAMTLVVSNGGTTATPTGIVFTEIKSNQNSRTYQVERIAADQDGTFTIEALHMPVNASGIPQVADQFDTAASWDIT